MNSDSAHEQPALLWEGLFGRLKAYLDATEPGLRVLVAPFITPQTLEELLGHGGVETYVVTSWRKDHLLAGVSSLETYVLCKRHGWHLFVNGRVHMKVYSRELRSAIAGSANLTGTGLGDGAGSNHEVLFFVPHLQRLDRIRILRLLAQSLQVDDQVYEAHKLWLDQPHGPLSSTCEDLLGPGPGMLTSHLPHSDDPERLWHLANGASPKEEWELAAMEHDLVFYPVSPGLPLQEFVAEIKLAFFEKPLVAKLAPMISERGLRFGAVKQWIRRNCTDTPVPRARDLTFLVQALIVWFQFLEPERYEVAIPGRHSQVLRRRPGS